MNKKLITYILLLLFFIHFTQTYAQTKSVKGKITSKVSKEGLPGVSILIKGTREGTITDVEGKYELQHTTTLPVDIEISFVGYKKKIITLTEETTNVDVELEEDTRELEELVVIGYGVQRKGDLTGSVYSVKGSDLVKIPSFDPMQSLQGKVPGIQILNSSGQPGASAVVRVRGIGTFNNSSPIYVVDGVIIDNINFLNSADIQSIEVLKDASATSIYGSRGANGVIVVTTKQGKAEQRKPVFSITSEYSTQNLSKKIDLLNGKEFATILNEAKVGNYNNLELLPNTDWQNLIFRTAPLQNYQISVTGSTERVQYYFGVGYYNQAGIVKNSEYQRLSIKINNTYKLTKHIKLGNNISISPYTQQVAPNVVYSAYRAQPIAKPYYNDGTYGVVPNVGNPLADLEYNSHNFNRGFRTVGNIFAEADIIEGLKFKTSIGIDYGSNKSTTYSPDYTVYNADGTASQQQNVNSDLYKGYSNNLTWIWENTLNYNKTIKKHHFDILVGYTMQETSSEFLNIHGENILRSSTDFWYIRASYIVDPTKSINTLNDLVNGVDPNQNYALISYLGRINYNFDNRYLFTFTFRRDGSSKFTQNNRYANFPSVALGWNMLNEYFMSPSKTILSQLKIRGSWGTIGNEKINYNRQFSLIQNELNPVFGINEALNPGATYGTAGNPNLVWETTYQTDIGIEFGFFGDKLVGELDYYNKTTKDILVDLLSPGYIGNGQGQKVTYNAGEVLNSGIEWNISYRNKISTLQYKIGFLGSTISNKVITVIGNNGGDPTLIGGFLGNGIPVTLSKPGLPIGAFYGYQTNGIFQNQAQLNAYPHSSQANVGDLIFVDTNEDKKITDADRIYLGSPIPSFIYGFNTELNFKNFDFNIDFQGQYGNKIFNGKEVVRPDPYNFEKHVINRWTGENSTNSEPRASLGGYNYTPSDKFIQDGSFLRIRNISLGYTLPENILKKIRMEQIRFYIKVTNLYTFSSFTGYSPEFATSDVLSNGIDNGVYPISAIYSTGFNVRF
ncbi:MAG: TonB-dependent receptor [Chitinophagaceae bacterium]|nr:TonB-dependent receptor [Chitinophagaceae bacterium]